MSNFNDIMIIFCLFLGDSIDDRFTINISRTEGKKIGNEKISSEILNFDHFKKLVCEYSGYTFKANKLRLWKVSISTKPEDKDDKLANLQKFAQDVHAEIDIKEQLGGVPLNPDDHIKDIFVEDPPNKHIHIIIEKPAEEPPLKRARTEEEPPWSPSPKKQKIMTRGTATLFAGKGSPIGLDNFSEILSRGYTIIDKTLLIAEFIDCVAIVSLVVRPRRFGKTINLTMLRDFFSIPIHPDNEDYRRELFVGTKIMKERPNIFDDYFCKHPVIFLSLKGYENCKNFEMMHARMCEELKRLYQDHKYIREILPDSDKERFDNIVKKDEYTIKYLLDYSLYDLSRWLKNYYRRKCIVLVDEYDHPLDIAYRNEYYEDARSFFSGIFSKLLKSNDENLEKAILVGVSRVAKSGYLSELNNLDVFPMHDQEFADKFGFTDDDVSIILRYYEKEDQLKEVKEWYDGYMASIGRIHLYNPWSINKFIRTNKMDAHWADTGGTATIKKLLWYSTEDFRKKTLTLLQKGTIDVKILKDIDYNTLSPRASDVIWTLLYYGGYLTMNEHENLCIPNMEVFTEWKGWLNSRISSNPDTMLEMLLQCDLTKFEEELPTMIMDSLSYFDLPDNLVEINYHWLMVGILSPVRYHNYELLSNREAGEGRFDVRISPKTENVVYPVSIIMEFKVCKKNKKDNDNDEYEYVDESGVDESSDEEIKYRNEDETERELRKKSEEALAQIVEKKYRTGIRTTKLVECGITFQGKRAYVLSRVLRKEGDQWVEDS